MSYDDRYRENPDYFGNPFPELIDYFSRQKGQGKVLDVGCGQGRNAIPLSEMGYQVRAIDVSEIAVRQLKARSETLNGNLQVELKAFKVVSDLDQFDFILLDGFFHFYNHQLTEEQNKMNFILNNVHSDCHLVFCFANHGDSVSVFREMTKKCALFEEANLRYSYTEPVSQWRFETEYFLAIVKRGSSF